MSAFPSLDDFESGNTTAKPMTMHDGDSDLMGGAGSTDFSQSASKFPELGSSGDLLSTNNDDFSASFPAVEEPRAFNGMISGPSEPYIPGHADTESAMHPSGSIPGPSGSAEPQVITEWRERQAAQIERRDAESAQRKQETMEKARRAIDDFYDSYNNKRDAAIKSIRKEQDAFLAQRDESTSGGTTWERISKLIDAKDTKAVRGDRDVSRMREILLSLKKDKNAPSAGL